MKCLMLSGTFMVVFWIGLYVQGKQEVKPVIDRPSEATLRRIAISDEKERHEILEQLRKDQAELEMRLIKLLNATKEKDKKFAFVYLMSLYRMKGTVWTLANIIELENPQDAPLDRRSHRYPVVYALIWIGMPSIPAMMGRLEKDDKELVVKLGTMVIDGILGRELGEIAIKQAIDKQTDQDKRKKLEAALAFFKDKLRR